MTALDILLIGALAVFVVAWWIRALPGRASVLLAAAVVALAAGVAGVLDTRWQAAAGALVAVILLLVLGISRLRKAPRREGVPWVSGPILTLLAAVAVAAIILFPVAPLPKPQGQFPVGVRTFEVADARRPGLFAAKPNEPRRLLVRVWYPAGATAGLTRRPYFTDPEANTTGRGMGELVGFPPFFTYLKHVRTNSWVDAPLSPGAKALPVVIYSHGYTSFLDQNTVLMEDLASHGYVVFSVQHTFDASPTVFPNGDVAEVDPELREMSKAQAKPTRAQIDALAGATLDARLNGQLAIRQDGLAKQDRITRSGVVWADDRRFLHDQLQARAVPAEVAQIIAASNIDRVGEMGMSFGGATAGTICMTDPRCAAGINLDGGDFPFQAFDAAMPVPFLMFHSDLGNMARSMGAEPPAPARSFNEFSYEPFATAGTRSDIYRISLKDSHHLGLSDFSLFVRRPLRDPLFGSAPSGTMIGAQDAFVRGFFDKHLRGIDNGFPKAELAAYHDWVTPLQVHGVRQWWAAKTPEDRAAIKARIEALRKN
jgi:predicted dienelactone hydrolase